MVQVDDIGHTEDGPYFEALLGNDCVVAPHARTDPATICFLDDYLLPLNIHSLLDVCFSINGVPYGIFSCEQIGAPVAWTQRQLQLLRQIGSRASLTLMRAATATVDTAPGALWEGSGSGRYRLLAGDDDGEDN
jgi:GAF domain-containing protein